jgi:hypothetical protein
VKNHELVLRTLQDGYVHEQFRIAIPGLVGISLNDTTSELFVDVDLRAGEASGRHPAEGHLAGTVDYNFTPEEPVEAVAQVEAAPEPEAPTTEALSMQNSREELLDRAKEYEVPGAASMTKEELLDAIIAVEHQKG